MTELEQTEKHHYQLTYIRKFEGTWFQGFGDSDREPFEHLDTLALQLRENQPEARVFFFESVQIDLSDLPYGEYVNEK